MCKEILNNAMKGNGCSLYSDIVPDFLLTLEILSSELLPEGTAVHHTYHVTKFTSLWPLHPYPSPEIVPNPSTPLWFLFLPYVIIESKKGPCDSTLTEETTLEQQEPPALPHPSCSFYPPVATNPNGAEAYMQHPAAFHGLRGAPSPYGR